MGTPLDSLKHILGDLGLSDAVDQHVLYPGNRRQQLLRGLMSRLLGGLAVEEVPLSTQMPSELSEDERFAERCRSLLRIFDIQATAEQIRGCSGDVQQDTQVLTKIAELLQAMQQQRSREQSAVAPEAVLQLLGNASENLGQLTSTSMQLFASDINDVLKTYSDQGALQKQAHLQQQMEAKRQQLQQQRQQTLTDGGSDCQGAVEEQWRQLLNNTEAALDDLVKEMQSFQKVYQQELSVWADAANKQEHSGHHSGQNTLSDANSVGQAAQHIVTAYKGLTAALEGFAAIKKQHQALQDVPIAILQQQKTVHKDSTAQLSQAATVLKQLMKH